MFQSLDSPYPCICLTCFHFNDLYVFICLHLLYSPGVNAERDMDDKVTEHCTDADVFVYVANGIATFETTVSQPLCSVSMYNMPCITHYILCTYCSLATHAH